MKQLPIRSESFQYLEKSFKEWLDILGYAPSTVYQMPNYIRELFHWLEQEGYHQVQQLSGELIRQYYEILKLRSNQRRSGALSNNYLNKHLQAFYKFMEYLRQSGRLQLPYLEIEREESNEKAIEVLSVEEIRELYRCTEGYNEGTRLEPFNARDRAMLSIFYGCGLRRNEGYHLDLSDVNFDRQVLHVRKGKNYKERFVPFNKTNSRILEEWVYDWRPRLLKDQREDAFFINQKGVRMGGQAKSIRLKILRQRSDDIELQAKEITLHTLRHSIATHLLAAGMNLEKISRFLGHSSLESTQIYTHLLKQHGKL